MSTETTQTLVEPASEKQLIIPKAPLAFDSRLGFQINTLDEAWRFAKFVIAAGWAPKGMDTEEAIVVCIQHGAEVGLPMMAAIQNICVINGRPSMYGDVALGLVLSKGICEEYRTWYEIDGKKLTDSEGNARTARADEKKNESLTAFFYAKRKGKDEPIVRSFSVSDAKEAKLFNKPGPWSDYTTRQMQWRARGFALRDGFPDALKGLSIAEESMDSPPPGFDHAKQVNDPVKPAFKRAAQPQPETLTAETTAVPASEILPPDKTASASQESPDKAKTAESAKPATDSAQPALKEADHALTKKPGSEATTKESGQQTHAANSPASVEDETQDPCAPLFKIIKEAQKTYGISDADVIAFAKEQEILPRRSQLGFDDLMDNPLGLIVKHLPKLIAKYSEAGAP